MGGAAGVILLRRSGWQTSVCSSPRVAVCVRSGPPITHTAPATNTASPSHPPQRADHHQPPAQVCPTSPHNEEQLLRRYFSLEDTQNSFYPQAGRLLDTLASPGSDNCPQLLTGLTLKPTHTQHTEPQTYYIYSLHTRTHHSTPFISPNEQFTNKFLVLCRGFDISFIYLLHTHTPLYFHLSIYLSTSLHQRPIRS